VFCDVYKQLSPLTNNDGVVKRTSFMMASLIL
jgi:hypothetical protein